MIGIALFFMAIIPCIEDILFNSQYTINSNISVNWIMNTIVLYPCIGYFLQNKLKINKPKKVISLLWLSNLLAFALLTYCTYLKFQTAPNISNDKLHDILSRFTILNCICVFITVKYIFEHIKMPKFLNKFILSLGSCTFGIFLFHIFVKNLDFVQNLFTYIKHSGINTMLAILIFCLIIFLLTYLLILILKKIPLFNKLVGS